MEITYKRHDLNFSYDIITVSYISWKYKKGDIMNSKIRKVLCNVLCVITLLTLTMLPNTVKASEIQKLSDNVFKSTDDLLIEDWYDLEIQFYGNDSYYSVTQNIYLPTSGKRGSTITWSSNNTSIISKTGVVTRPIVEDKYITLTATLTRSGKSEQKVFDLVVLKKEVDIPEVSMGAYYEVIKGQSFKLEGYVKANSEITSIVADISDYNFSSSKVTVNPKSTYYNLNSITLNTSDSRLIAGNTYTIRLYAKTDTYREEQEIATANIYIAPKVEAKYELLKGAQRNLYYYNQLDSTYKDYAYGYTTLGEDGSALTSMAMVISSFKEQVFDPIYMVNWANKNNYIDTNYSNSSLIQVAANSHSLSVESLNPIYNNENTIKKVTQALKEGKLVVVLLTNVYNPTFGQTKDQFIVLRGITDSGKILIADPADNTQRTRTKKSEGYDIKTIINESKAVYNESGPFWIISNNEAIPKVTGLDSAYSILPNSKLTLAGTVSAQSKLINVKLMILKEVNGTLTNEGIRLEANPDSSSYDLRKLGLNTASLKAGDYKIRIYATTSSDSKVSTLIYEASLTIRANETQVLDQDYNKLNIGYSSGDNSSYVTGQLTLPTRGEGGSSITWISGNSQVIKINNGTGVVYRPTENTSVTLMATLTYGNNSKVKVFQLNVIAGKKTYITGNKDYYEVLEGEKVNLSGVVQSSSKITSLRVSIEGYPWYVNAAWPYSTSYNLNNFTIDTSDWNLRLAAGTYQIKVWITDDSYMEDKTPIATMTLKVISQNKNALMDLKGIKISYGKGDSWKKVTKNITLPRVGKNGSIITWVSKNKSIISNTGVVKRPKYKDAKVTLVATVTYGNETLTRNIVLTVKAQYKNNWGKKHD